MRSDVSHLAHEALGPGDAPVGTTHMPTHLADLATDSFEQQFTLGLLEKEENALAEVSAALDRLRRGTFGRCEDCKEMIASARLDALPYARKCVECAKSDEAGIKTR